MDLGLTDKKALITGASKGLGAAAALALAREGAKIIINSRDRQRLEKAQQKIRSITGFEPPMVIGDVSRPEDIDLIVEQAGPVDILVSNAGGPPPGDVSQHSRETWEEACHLTLFSAINLTRAVIEGMKDRGWGRLIYITSVGVLQPIDNLILSNTFRSGVTAFCKTVSNNYAKYGITANCVCPGYTATERLTELARKMAEVTNTPADNIIKGFADSNPTKRIGLPEETAALIAFLAGEKAGYITGTSIPVDGGLVKGLI